METARFFSPNSNDSIKCGLCGHSCFIPSGSFGACGVRGNKNGKALIPYYGYVTALAVDPIEKKPLYHFRPGSKILSVGFAGCNLRCPFCQNWHISQCTKGVSSDGVSVNTAPGRKMSAGDLVSSALHEGSMSIAYTYSEPLVHIEFLLDCMALARRHGIANVLVTNGCINGEAAGELLALTDAANIDLKCFSAETYAKVLGGDLDSVLAFIKLALEKKVHVELTTLVVPGLNDSTEELDKCAAFIASLGGVADLRDGPSGETPAVPWHLSAYHPEYRWNAPPTDAKFLLGIKKRVSRTLPYVYAGNIAGEENSTLCPHCGKTLVQRFGYRVEASGLKSPAEGENFFRCAYCGNKTAVSS
jgi:pyruvate formate lyase activating enzyme